MIDLVKCIGEGCKTDEEIKQYFAGRFLFVLSNQIRFDPTKYGRESIVKESTIHTEILGDWSTRTAFKIH